MSHQNLTDSSNCSMNDTPSNWLVLPTALMIIFSCIGFVMNFISTVVLVESRGRVPGRVKILVITSCLIYVARCLYFLAKCAYVICILVSPHGYRIVAMSYATCVLEQTFYISTGFGHFLSLFYICIERFLVMEFHKIFVHMRINGRKHSVLFSLVVISTLGLGVAVHFILTAMSYNDERPKQKLAFCYVSFIWDKAISNIYTFLCIVIQILTCVAYYALHQKSRKNFDQFVVHRIHDNLNERFFVWSNIKVTVWLMKVMIPSTVLMTVVLVSVLIFRTQVNFDFRYTVLYSVWIICFYSFDAFLFSMILLRFNPSIGEFLQARHPNLYLLLFKGRIKFSGFAYSMTNKVDVIPVVNDVENPRYDSKKFTTEASIEGKEKKKHIVRFQINPAEQDAILNAAWNRQCKNSRKSINRLS